jgi:hypothetical protein
MVASDDRYRAIDPNHVEYFSSGAVPMPPPHVQTIWSFVSGRRKGDGQRVCPTDQRHYAVAVFATDALRLYQLQCQPPQRQCFSIRCHGRKNLCPSRRKQVGKRPTQRRNGARWLVASAASVSLLDFGPGRAPAPGGPADRGARPGALWFDQLSLGISRKRMSVLAMVP